MIPRPKNHSLCPGQAKLIQQTCNSSAYYYEDILAKISLMQSRLNQYDNLLFAEVHTVMSTEPQNLNISSTVGTAVNLMIRSHALWHAAFIV